MLLHRCGFIVAIGFLSLCFVIYVQGLRSARAPAWLAPTPGTLTSSLASMALRRGLAHEELPEPLGAEADLLTPPRLPRPSGAGSQAQHPSRTSDAGVQVQLPLVPKNSSEFGRWGVHEFGRWGVHSDEEALLKKYMGDEPYHYVRRQRPSEAAIQDFEQEWARRCPVDRAWLVCKLFRTWPRALMTLMRRMEAKKAQAKQRVRNAEKRKYSRARTMLKKLRQRAAMLAIEDGTP